MKSLEQVDVSEAGERLLSVETWCTLWFFFCCSRKLLEFSRVRSPVKNTGGGGGEKVFGSCGCRWKLWVLFLVFQLLVVFGENFGV